ncbi:MAG: hypothetical protein K9G62_04155 [Alphaproteobacteria bacterium]|nr:hypothetical protein [Alphaproteobacteria bacterium]
MTQTLTAIEHACNVIRRDVEEEMRDLSLLFLVHEPGGFSRALQEKKDRLLACPAGDSIVGALSSSGSESYHGFAGLAFWTEKRLFSLLSKPKAAAVFVINAAFFQPEADPAAEVWHLTAQALRYIRSRGKSLSSPSKSPCFAPVPPEELGGVRGKMLADVFAAVMLELKGRKGEIKGLAKRRCLMTIQPSPLFPAEEFPYPLAFEALDLIWKETVSRSFAKDSLVRHALNIGEEIDETFDDMALSHWSAFAQAAQEMAWMGYDKSKVLSCAIFTSENPYVRSMAYLVAEILNLDPAAPGEGIEYNGFAEADVNERLHFKACERAFRRLSDARERDTPFQDFLQLEIQGQNERLLQGRVSGWCVPALQEAAGSSPGEAAIVFQNHIKAVAWGDLLDLARKIIERRRSGGAVHAPEAAGFCAEGAVLKGCLASI